MGMSMESFRERVQRLKSNWAEVQATPEYQERERQDALDRADHERWLAKERLASMDIPLIHALDILESRYEPNPVDARLVAFDESLRSVCILAGGVGSTKTSAACNWLARVGGKFVHVYDLAHASTFDAEWGRFKTVPNLVIDDLGAEIASKSEWVVGKVREVLESRIADCLSTVITTNLTQPMFVQRYGDAGGRLLDRLKAHGEWFDVPVFTSQRKAQQDPGRG